MSKLLNSTVHNVPSPWQAKPRALIYWQSDPKFEELEEKEEVIQTNKTFTTISKVRKSYLEILFLFTHKYFIQGNVQSQQRIDQSFLLCLQQNDG